MSNCFTYQTYSIGDDRQTVYFDYLLEQNGQQYQFRESLRFPVSLPDTASIHSGLRALHLALGISYYKIFVSPQLVHPYAMDSSEAAFWNDVWRQGLGEFLFVNQLSPDLLAQFSEQDGTPCEPADSTGLSGVLLGIGGGKDSIVAGELLKACGQDISGFVMATGEQRGQTEAVAEVMGITLHGVERSLDKRLLEVQELPGAHKGHIPISLIFGLVGTVLASASGKQYVVVANEASASIPRLSWEHGKVNHQWSKSFEFEQVLQDYIQRHIDSGITYFSAVRQLTSIGVAKVFCNYPQYFEVFTSDNYIFRINPAQRPNARWSVESPKSLSSFILLAPWLDPATMETIFGRDFLAEASLEQLFLELTGQEGTPPLDCVGTVDELILSLNLAHNQGKFVQDALMQIATKRGVIYDFDWKATRDRMLRLQSDQALPAELSFLITMKLQEKVA